MRRHQVGRRYLLFSALLLGWATFSLPSSAQVEIPPWGPEGICSRGLYDREAFKEVLSSNEREMIALNRKMLYGGYERARDLDTRISRLAAERLIDRIQVNLARLDVSHQTAALLYTVHDEANVRAVCSWLVTTDDFNLHRAIVPDRSLTQMVQDGLGVTVRAAARAPVRRNVPPTPSAADAAIPILPAQGRGALEQTAMAMLSPEIKAKLISRSINRLLILAEDDLGTVPFAALPVTGDTPLIELASIVIVPDIGALLSPQPRGAYEFTGTKLVVGDPDFSAEKIWDMKQLPDAKAEAIEIAQRFAASALVGKSATHQAILARLRAGKLDLIYFATHGIADDVNPMDGSFLALSGEHLYGREIKRLKLQKSAPLVVMSACQTGLGKVFRGGVFGLARAWFFAGAPQVVMSLWNVDDHATKSLMVAFMTKVAALIPPEHAMQQAMNETRPLFSDPVLWAGFAIYGQPTRY